MRMNRREFLHRTAAATGCAVLPAYAFAGIEDGLLILNAEPSEASLMGAGKPRTKIWSYQGKSPGPEIRVRQGAQVKVRLVNKLLQPTTVHWHGVRIENAMDGVPGLTQEAVPPGESFDYIFNAPDAGTYWYHSHHQTWEQVARGLYGVLIVEERERQPFDRDITLVFDDWRLGKAGQIHEKSLGDIREWAHGGRLGNWPTVNSQYRPDIPARSGERLRLRLVNASNARIFELRFRDHDARVIAVDGQPVTPYSVTGKSIVLAPAQRVDLSMNASLTPGSAASIDEVSQDFPVELASFKYSGMEAMTRSAGERFTALPANPLAEDLSLPDALTAKVVMAGGAMGRMRSATYNGQEMSIRDLVEARKVWALNGVVGLTDKPLFDAPKGRTVVITYENQTAFEHPMHLHGHHFKVVRRNGKPVANAPWRDTQLVGRREKVDIAFVAGNAGKWALHCHTLEHAAAGMFTWFNVTG